jgi:RNA polymerase sporulation-specific sigma factor
MNINPPDVVERLLNENEKLVPYFASRWGKKKKAKWDDLISFGKIGLREAAMRYDPARAKFSTYASFWIRKYLHLAVKEQAMLTGRISFDDPVGYDDGDMTRHEVIADKNARTPAELSARRDLLERFEHLMNAVDLSAREREIIVQRYGLGGDKRKTQKQIGRELGLTGRRIGQIEKEAREKLEALPPDFPDFS